MQNKKLIILIVLGILAVISLTYGIVTPPKGRRKLSSRRDEKNQLAKRIIPAKRHAKRTDFASWGRNPFVPAWDAGETAGELILSGIIWDKETPRVIINDRIIGVGDKIGPNTVVDIKQDRVILNDGTGNFELMMGK